MRSSHPIDVAMDRDAIKSREGPLGSKASSCLEVCVVGLGYVGLPTAALLAERGHRVHGVDHDPRVVERVMSGDAGALEPGLAPLVRHARAAGTLRADDAASPADVFLVCVPTPCDQHGRPDLSHVADAVHSLVGIIAPGNLVVLESTVPPGTTRALIGQILTDAGFELGVDVFVAHAPERVLPGAVLHELENGFRIVGGLTPACTERALSFYRSWLPNRIEGATAEIAELAKLAENSFRDVNIAFANTLADVCAHLDADPWEVIRLANQHPRVAILRPGPGVGGHCIPVDPWFLVAAAPDQSRLLVAARHVNDARPKHVLERVRALVATSGASRIACLGLTYKAQSDDLRNSPALTIVRTLVEEYPGLVRVADPYLTRSPIDAVPLEDAALIIAECDIILALVPHPEFRSLSVQSIPGRHVVDAAGVWAV